MTRNIRVTVAGATGYVGGSVVEGLRSHEFWVRALTRDPARLKNPQFCDDVFVGHATRPETLRGLCDGIDVVFSSIGIRSFARKPTVWEVVYTANINILNEARAAGVKHVIFISALRAPEMARICPIAVAREMVVGAIVGSGLRYTIYRPTAFFNDIQEVFYSAAKRGVYYQIGNPEVRMNPLHGLDFADEVAQAIVDSSRWNIIRPVGGPEILSRRAIVALAFQALERPVKVRRLPTGSISLAAALIKPFHYNLYSILKFMEFALQTEDMTGDPIGRRRIGDAFRELFRRERASRGGSRPGAPDQPIADLNSAAVVQQLPG
ncbi:MAG: NAD(P)H-binding protein [Chloroflexales bacterium]|nr:NAD(P)H-binding protein [Chloroflexales bacterium]